MWVNKLSEDTNYVPTDFYRQMLSVLSQTWRWHTPQVIEMCAHELAHMTRTHQCLCGERNEWILCVCVLDRQDEILTFNSSFFTENCVNLCVVRRLDCSQLNWNAPLNCVYTNRWMGYARLPPQNSRWQTANACAPKLSVGIEITTHLIWFQINIENEVINFTVVAQFRSIGDSSSFILFSTRNSTFTVDDWNE